MSQENVEIVRRLYEALNRNDWDAALALTDPGVEWETDPRHPKAGVYRGRKAFRSFIEDLEGPFEDTIYTLEQIFEEGDHVVVFTTIRRGLAGSSAEVTVQIGELWTVRHGKIVRGQGFGEREKALEAVGLSE